jgi:hypothetical protein
LLTPYLTVGARAKNRFLKLIGTTGTRFSRRKKSDNRQLLLPALMSAAPANRVIFAPVFTALDFSFGLVSIPRSGFLGWASFAQKKLGAIRPRGCGIRKKARKKSRASSLRFWVSLVVHTPHATHTTARHTGGRTFLLRPFGDHGFRGDQQPGDRRSVLQSRTYDLRGIDDALAE